MWELKKFHLGEGRGKKELKFTEHTFKLAITLTGLLAVFLHLSANPLKVSWRVRCSEGMGPFKIGAGGSCIK